MSIFESFYSCCICSIRKWENLLWGQYSLNAEQIQSLRETVIVNPISFLHFTFYLCYKFTYLLLLVDISTPSIYITRIKSLRRIFISLPLKKIEKRELPLKLKMNKSELTYFYIHPIVETPASRSIWRITCN